MFKVVITKPSDSSKVSYCFANPHAFDFIKVLPKQFSQMLGEQITKDDFTTYKFDESVTPEIVAKIGETAGNKLDLDVAADDTIRVSDSSDAMLQEWTGTALTLQWPYDNNGNFLGNN